MGWVAHGSVCITTTSTTGFSISVFFKFVSLLKGISRNAELIQNDGRGVDCKGEGEGEGEGEGKGEGEGEGEGQGKGEGQGEGEGEGEDEGEGEGKDDGTGSFTVHVPIFQISVKFLFFSKYSPFKIVC